MEEFSTKTVNFDGLQLLEIHLMFISWPQPKRLISSATYQDENDLFTICLSLKKLLWDKSSIRYSQLLPNLVLAVWNRNRKKSQKS